MSSKSLRELIEESQSAIQTYKHPDVSECHDKLNEILVATGFGDSSRDELAYVGIEDGTVYIRTEYSVRGCEQSDDYEFPESILDADDPVSAAKRYGLEKKLSDARYELNEARRILIHREAAFDKAQADLAALSEAQEERIP